MKLKFCEYWAKFCSFCRGPEIKDLTRKTHFWPLEEVYWALKSTWVLIMIFMYLTAHRKGPKDLTSPFDRSHAGILSWKMTNFTPFFWLPMEIRHTRWILNPYKVYVFWKLHVLGTYWVKSQICSTNIEGVGLFTEHQKWNVTKILKCVIELHKKYQL